VNLSVKPYISFHKYNAFEMFSPNFISRTLLQAFNACTQIHEENGSQTWTKFLY